MRATTIYALKDPLTDEIRYVGKTVQTLCSRLRHHRNAKHRTHCANWIQKLRKLELMPIPIVLEIVPAGGDWVAAEKHWIASYRTAGARLTNLTDGGEGSQGYICSDATRQKLSAKSKGRPFSAEHRKHLSQAAAQRVNSEEYKQNMSQRIKGRTFSESTRQKISDAKRGRRPSAATCRKMSNWQRGRKLPESTKAKIAASLRARANQHG